MQKRKIIPFSILHYHSHPHSDYYYYSTSTSHLFCVHLVCLFIFMFSAFRSGFALTLWATANGLNLTFALLFKTQQPRLLSRPGMTLIYFRFKMNPACRVDFRRENTKLDFAIECEKNRSWKCSRINLVFSSRDNNLCVLDRTKRGKTFIPTDVVGMAWTVLSSLLPWISPANFRLFFFSSAEHWFE